jgi:hypothetical protein
MFALFIKKGEIKMSVFIVEGNSFRAEDLASHDILKTTKDSKLAEAIKLIKKFVRNGNTFFLSQPELRYIYTFQFKNW